MTQLTEITVEVTQDDLTGVETRINTLEKRLQELMRPGYSVVATKRYIVFNRGKAVAGRHWLCLQDYQFLCGVNYPLPYVFKVSLPSECVAEKRL